MEDQVYQDLWQRRAFCDLAALIDTDPRLSFERRIIWKAKLSLRIPRQSGDLSLLFIDTFVSGAANFLSPFPLGLADETVHSLTLELRAWLGDQNCLTQKRAGTLASYAETSFAWVQILFHRWSRPASVELITPGYLWQLNERDPLRHRYMHSLPNLVRQFPCLQAYTQSSMWHTLRDQAMNESITEESCPSPSHPKLQYTPLWEQTDPFRALGVEPSSSKAEVMAAMMKRIRQEPQHMALWRKAQNEIFTPSKVLRWRFFNEPVQAEQRPKTQESSLGPHMAVSKGPEAMRDAKEWVSHV